MVKPKGLLTFPSKPSISGTGVTVGPLEKKSPFISQFDKVFDDERSGLSTNEQGHAKLFEDACMILLNKKNKKPEDIDFLLTGDLVNQMTPSSFSAKALEVPYLGLFSACATTVSSMITAALLTETGLSTFSIAGSSSQHNSIERQFRYPIEYGAQKPETAQWTVTAAGAAAIVPNEKKFPSIICATVGRVVDFGLTDPLNMGAAMAPAAADTLERHLTGHNRKSGQYDAIVTGDLGKIGFEIYKELIKKKGIRLSKSFRDAGVEFYGGDPDFFAGASGSGCSAAMYFTEIYSKLLEGTYKRVLLIATGALLSPLTVQQEETIPCIAHAIEIMVE